MTLNKLILILFPVLFAVNSMAQYQHTMSDFQSDSAGMISGIYFNSNVASDRLTTAFFKEYQSDVLTKETRLKMSERLSNVNRLGADINTGIFASWLSDSVFEGEHHDVRWILQFANRQHIDMRFSKDLFNLAFLGNKMYAGKLANAGDFRLNVLNYQQLQFGGIKDMDSVNRVGIAISLLSGQNFISVTAPEATLFTDSLGEQVDLTLSALVMQSDTSHKKLGSINGWGIGAELFYEHTYHLAGIHPALRGKFRVEFSDLGFINWNSRTLVQAIDTTRSYTGFDIGDITGVDPNAASNYRDSVVPDYNKYNETLRQTTFLPGIIGATLVQPLGRHTITACVKVRSQANFTPFFLLRENYRLTDWLSCGIMVGSGGYARYNVGFDLCMEISHYSVQLGSAAADGWVAPTTSGSTNGFLIISKRF